VWSGRRVDIACQGGGVRSRFSLTQRGGHIRYKPPESAGVPTERVLEQRRGRDSNRERKDHGSRDPLADGPGHAASSSRKSASTFIAWRPSARTNWWLRSKHAPRRSRRPPRTWPLTDAPKDLWRSVRWCWPRTKLSSPVRRGRAPGDPLPRARDGPVLRRPYDLMFSTLNERKDPLDKIEKACRKTVGIYPAHFEFDFQRLDPGLFEMNIRRCFFRDFFGRHDARLVTTVMCAFDVNFMKAIDSLGQRPAGGAHLPALARRRPVPVRGTRDRRPPRRIHRQARRAIRRQAAIRLTLLVVARRPTAKEG
jgi:hypothetical protein